MFTIFTRFVIGGLLGGSWGESGRCAVGFWEVVSVIILCLGIIGRFVFGNILYHRLWVGSYIENANINFIDEQQQQRPGSNPAPSPPKQKQMQRQRQRHNDV